MHDRSGPWRDRTSRLLAIQAARAAARSSAGQLTVRSFTRSKCGRQLRSAVWTHRPGLDTWQRRDARCLVPRTFQPRSAAPIRCVDSGTRACNRLRQTRSLSMAVGVIAVKRRHEATLRSRRTSSQAIQRWPSAAEPTLPRDLAAAARRGISPAFRRRASRPGWRDRSVERPSGTPPRRVSPLAQGSLPLSTASGCSGFGLWGWRSRASIGRAPAAPWGREAEESPPA